MAGIGGDIPGGSVDNSAVLLPGPGQSVDGETAATNPLRHAPAARLHSGASKSSTQTYTPETLNP